MEASLLLLAAVLAASSLLQPARPGVSASRYPGRFARRALGTSLVAAVAVPIGVAAVLLVLRPDDAPLRFLHACSVLGLWMAATVLGACTVSRLAPWATPRAATAGAVSALAATGAAVSITPFDRFAGTTSGPVGFAAAVVAALLIVDAAVTAARCLSAPSPMPGASLRPGLWPSGGPR